MRRALASARFWLRAVGVLLLCVPPIVRAFREEQRT